ncbi:MAG: DUF1573 domain-containing protein [Planctomycetota bacterium]
MLRKTFLLVACLTLVVSPCFGQQWAAKMFQTTDHDFGTVARGSKAEFNFTLSNLYIDDVHIVTAYSSCGCTSIEIVKPTLKTYEEGSIRAVFNTPTFLGSRSATITVIIDKPMPAEILLHVRGVIRGDVVFEPGSVQLGDVELGTPVERKVRVNRSGWGDWQITEVKSSNPHISAKVVDSSRQNGWTTTDLSVTLDKGAPAGYLQDHLLLVTSEGQSVQMPLAVEGRVIANLAVSPSSLFMGVVHPGQEVTKSLVVKGIHPFKVLSITCEDKAFKFTPTSNEAKMVHVIPVTFVAGNTEGKVTKTIRIVTDLGQTSPELSAYAVISSQTAANDK